MATNPFRRSPSRASRDIPFNKLLAQPVCNVRRVKAGVSVEDLAEDIARRGLLQGLSVRAGRSISRRRRDRHVRDPGRRSALPGAGTAREAEAPGQDRAGARASSATGGIAEEDSPRRERPARPVAPARSIPGVPRVLREKGQSEEEIAAAFFVSVAIL